MAPRCSQSPAAGRRSAGKFDYETHPVEQADHEDLALLLGLGFEFN